MQFHFQVRKFGPYIYEGTFQIGARGFKAHGDTAIGAFARATKGWIKNIWRRQ